MALANTRVRGFAYPAAIRSARLFADISWGNDVVDSVTFVGRQDDAAYLVWIDAMQLDSRTQEWGWDPHAPVSAANMPPPRFAVHRLAWQGDVVSTMDENIADDLLLETDDPDALVAFVAGLA